MKVKFSDVGWDSIFFMFFGNCRVSLQGSTLSVATSYRGIEFLFVVKFLDSSRECSFEEWRDWIVSEFKKAREFVFEESLGETGRPREFFEPAFNVKIRLEIEKE